MGAQKKLIIFLNNINKKYINIKLYIN